MIKSKKKKKKRYMVTLTEGELKRLTAYAAANRIGRSVALMRLLRQSLRDATADVSTETVSRNQLRLFDTVQMNIFES